MRSIPGILSLLLALTLVVSNVALSGHLSSHKATGSELCSLCMHAAGTDNAMVTDSALLQVISLVDCPDRPYASPYVLPITLYAHPSRAPPHVS